MNVPPHPPASDPGPDPADLRWVALAEAESLGESLTAEERAHLRAHVPTDPALRAEQALREAMEHWGEGSLPGEDDEAVIAAALAGHLHETSERPRARRRVGLAAGLAVAAAVVLAVMLGTRDDASPSEELARVDAPALEDHDVPEDAHAPAPLPRVSGTWVDEHGAPLTGVPAAGVVLVARSAACMGHEAGGRLCVKPGARVRVVAAEVPALEWLEGRGELTAPEGATPAAMVLEVRVAGTRVAGHASVVVESTMDGHWSLAVEEGELTLHTPEGVRSLGVGERWAPGERTAESTGENTAAARDHGSRVATPDAASLLRQARTARAEGSMADAAALYRRLLKAYPRSPSSGPAWVALGQVELARGRAQAALEAFDRYLARGGPLSEEAAYGRIEALHRLGRTAEERSASERFLAKYPGSSYAAKLRRNR